MKIKLDIVKYRFLCLALSALLLTPGIIAMIYSMVVYPTHSPVKVGIDYTGGTTLQYGVKEDISNDKMASVRTNLVNNGIENPYLQVIHVNASQQESDLKSILSIRTKFIDENSNDQDKITNVVSSSFESPAGRPSMTGPAV